MCCVLVMTKCFKELLPDAELHYLDHRGHVPTQERQRETLRLIRKFLDKIDYAAWFPGGSRFQGYLIQ